MEEKRTELTTFRVDISCPECQNGRMLSTGIQGEGRRTFVHRCSSCGHQQYLTREYPFLEMREKTQVVRKNKV